MKIIFKQMLIACSGFLFLSMAYAVEPLSTVADTNASEAMPASATETSLTDTATTTNTMEAQKEDLPKTDMTGFSRGTVARSIFTTLIDSREPVDKVKQVPEQTSDVFYFTELRDMQGQTAKHRWEYKGKVIAEVKFNVRGPRWRVWSKKSFTPGWAGDWKVSVLNGADEVISEEVIAFTEPLHDIIESEPVNNNKADNNNVSVPNTIEAPTVNTIN